MLGGSSVVEHLVSIGKVLGSFSNTGKNNLQLAVYLALKSLIRIFENWGSLGNDIGFVQTSQKVKRGILHSLGCPGTLYGEQASLKLTEPPASAFWIRGMCQEIIFQASFSSLANLDLDLVNWREGEGLDENWELRKVKQLFGCWSVFFLCIWELERGWFSLQREQIATCWQPAGFLKRTWVHRKARVISKKQWQKQARQQSSAYQCPQRGLHSTDW